MAWVDGRGFVDGGDVAAFEEAQGDQTGEAEDRNLDAMAAGGGAQPGVGDHSGGEPEADPGVAGAAAAAGEGLSFYSAKQQIRLPSNLVDGRGVNGGARDGHL